MPPDGGLLATCKDQPRWTKRPRTGVPPAKRLRQSLSHPSGRSRERHDDSRAAITSAVTPERRPTTRLSCGPSCVSSPACTS